MKLNKEELVIDMFVDNMLAAFLEEVLVMQNLDLSFNDVLLFKQIQEGGKLKLFANSISIEFIHEPPQKFMQLKYAA